MDQTQTNSPVMYPDRVYDGKDFVPNLNREQSSDNLTTVLTDKNEVLGFPDHVSKQEMQGAIEADRNGSISTYKPTFYDKFIRGPLEQMGMAAFQPPFVTDIKPTPERAFATSFARAATADVFKPAFSDQEAKANPVQAFAGSLAGSVAAFATGGALLDGFNLSQLTPFAENIIKGGILGGAYKGASETSNELRDEDHPDLAKIGKGVLHDAMWWGGIGGIVGGASKPVGVAASAGLGYLMAKSDGADEPSALLNGAVLSGSHLLQTHGDNQEVREFVTQKLQENVTDYMLAKNPLVHPEVAAQGGREFVENHAEDVLDQNPQYQEWLAKNAVSDTPEEPKMRVPLHPAEEGKAEAFKLPQEPLTEEEIAQQKMFEEGSPLQIVSSNPEMMSQMVKNITQQVMLKEGGENASQRGEGAQSGSGQEGVGGQAQAGVHLRDDGKTEGVGQEEVVTHTPGQTTSDSNLNGAQDESSGKARLLEQEESSKLQKESQQVSKQASSSETSIPSNEGENKVSGLSKSVEEDAIHKGLVDELGDLPTYKARDMAEIAKKVSDFIENNPELAKKIALGDAPEQDGLRAQELFTGLKAKAFKEGDVPLIHELGTSEKASAMATELGQRVKALDSKDENSPIKIVQDIQKARKASNNTKEQKDIVKHLKDEMKKAKPKQNDWDFFLESIKC